jgi:hypothetical protein
VAIRPPPSRSSPLIVCYHLSPGTLLPDGEAKVRLGSLDGVVPFLAKPFAIDKLLAVIQEILGSEER